MFVNIRKLNKENSQKELNVASNVVSNFGNFKVTGFTGNTTNGPKNYPVSPFLAPIVTLQPNMLSAPAMHAWMTPKNALHYMRYFFLNYKLHKLTFLSSDNNNKHHLKMLYNSKLFAPQ